VCCHDRPALERNSGGFRRGNERRHGVRHDTQGSADLRDRLDLVAVEVAVSTGNCTAKHCDDALDLDGLVLGGTDQVQGLVVAHADVDREDAVELTPRLGDVRLLEVGHGRMLRQHGHCLLLLVGVEVTVGPASKCRGRDGRLECGLVGKALELAHTLLHRRFDLIGET